MGGSAEFTGASAGMVPEGAHGSRGGLWLDLAPRVSEACVEEAVLHPPSSEPVPSAEPMKDEEKLGVDVVCPDAAAMTLEPSLPSTAPLPLPLWRGCPSGSMVASPSLSRFRLPACAA
jgi:hypothetical protein